MDDKEAHTRAGDDCALRNDNVERQTDRQAHTNIHNSTHDRYPTNSHMNAIYKQEGRLRVDTAASYKKPCRTHQETA